MPNDVAFTIQRRTLVAGNLTPITPPYPCFAVKIANATADDLQVLSQISDTAQFSVISAGFEDVYSNPGHHLFRSDKWPAFYLNSIAGGAVVLTWM